MTEYVARDDLPMWLQSACVPFGTNAKYLSRRLREWRHIVSAFGTPVDHDGFCKRKLAEAGFSGDDLLLPGEVPSALTSLHDEVLEEW